MTGVELLRGAGERLGPGSQREVAQAAFFQLSKLATHFLSRPRYHPGDAKLASQRDANLGAVQPFFADELAKRVRQFFCALLGIEGSRIDAPSDRTRNHTIAAPVGSTYCALSRPGAASNGILRRSRSDLQTVGVDRRCCADLRVGAVLGLFGET